MNPVTIAALVLGAAVLGAVLLAVSAFRRPMPHLAKTLSATFGADFGFRAGPAGTIPRTNRALIGSGRRRGSRLRSLWRTSGVIWTMGFGRFGR